ncbi:MAG TPA: STAS domain-containing protein [Myxococcota bacterium]|nr:STAS domain-containing protein [Myxococcota bacterium]
MLKITRSDLDSTRTALRLEGRVTEASLLELERARTECQQEGRHLVLDLAGVSFVDRRSVAALRGLRRVGIVFTGCSPFVSELLKEETR